LSAIATFKYTSVVQCDGADTILNDGMHKTRNVTVRRIGK